MVIHNGQKVTPIRKYPWIVLIFKKEKFMCSGVIISSEFILTS
ncbi:unnamed protein product, partial [Larinioides sclopetarius]